MNDATATSAMAGFSTALNGMLLGMRKSMTYDQGREMARHAEIIQQTRMAVYFCDPHSPCPIEVMGEAMQKAMTMRQDALTSIQ